MTQHVRFVVAEFVRIQGPGSIVRNLMTRAADRVQEELWFIAVMAVVARSYRWQFWVLKNQILNYWRPDPAHAAPQSRSRNSRPKPVVLAGSELEAKSNCQVVDRQSSCGLWRQHQRGNSC